MLVEKTITIWTKQNYDKNVNIEFSAHDALLE